jgi:hypothetical protein
LLNKYNGPLQNIGFAEARINLRFVPQNANQQFAFWKGRCEGIIQALA